MAMRRTRKAGIQSGQQSGVARDVKPIEIPFAEKLKQDKLFLISMIDDPVKAFRTYGFNGDDRMMAMLQGMAVNLQQRAVSVFREILRMEDARNGCNACNGCRACKACMTLGV